MAWGAYVGDTMLKKLPPMPTSATHAHLCHPCPPLPPMPTSALLSPPSPQPLSLTPSCLCCAQLLLPSSYYTHMCILTLLCSSHDIAPPMAPMLMRTCPGRTTPQMATHDELPHDHPGCALFFWTHHSPSDMPSPFSTCHRHPRCVPHALHVPQSQP